MSNKKTPSMKKKNQNYSYDCLKFYSSCGFVTLQKDLAINVEIPEFNFDSREYKHFMWFFSFDKLLLFNHMSQQQINICNNFLIKFDCLYYCTISGTHRF